MRSARAMKFSVVSFSESQQWAVHCLLTAEVVVAAHAFCLRLEADMDKSVCQRAFDSAVEKPFSRGERPSADVQRWLPNALPHAVRSVASVVNSLPKEYWRQEAVPEERLAAFIKEEMRLPILRPTSPDEWVWVRAALTRPEVDHVALARAVLPLLREI